MSKSSEERQEEAEHKRLLIATYVLTFMAAIAGGRSCNDAHRIGRWLAGKVAHMLTPGADVEGLIYRDEIGPDDAVADRIS